MIVRVRIFYAKQVLGERRAEAPVYLADGVGGDHARLEAAFVDPLLDVE
jgi:hypothetical protein